MLCTLTYTYILYIYVPHHTVISTVPYTHIRTYSNPLQLSVTLVHTHMHRHPHPHTPTHTHTHAQTPPHTQTHTYQTHTHTHPHTHTHTHTHIPNTHTHTLTSRIMSMMGHTRGAFFDGWMVVLRPSMSMVTRSWMTLYTSWCSLSALSRAGGYRGRGRRLHSYNDNLQSWDDESCNYSVQLLVQFLHFLQVQLSTNN